MRHAERETRRVDRQLDREEAAAAMAANAAVPADGSPEVAGGTRRRQHDGYDPLGNRDTQGASSR
jgi:hypothetical protein